MSRSRKKVGGFVDRNPFMKKYANRQLRRLSPEQFEYEFGRQARVHKYTCPWNICDWRDVYFSEAEVLHSFADYPHLKYYYIVHQYYSK